MTRQSLGLLGAEVKARPALLRWYDSPVTRTAIAARWIAWLAWGWPPTAIAATALALIFAVTAPVFAAIAVVGFAWATNIHRYKTRALLAGAVSTAAMVWWTWTSVHPLVQPVLIALVGVWPADASIARLVHRYQLRRWWCEVRRGLPVRFAVLAAKATQIQGLTGGERQLADGERPLVDHPAIARQPHWVDNQAWALCTVPPGRNSQAFADILAELAASWGHVTRIDLIFVDAHQTYGWLVTTFGQPLLPPGPPDLEQRPRLTTRLADALPHLATGLAVVATTWTAIT